jgi:hypothetical protein
MGTSKVARVQISQRTRNAVKSERIQDAASGIVFDKSREIKGVLSIASPTLGALIRLSDAAKAGDLIVESVKLGIEKFSDNPSSEIIRVLMHIAIATPSPAGMSMACDLVARAAAQTFLSIVKADTTTPSKLTLKHIESSFSKTTPFGISSIFVEKVVSSIIGFSLDRVLGLYTGPDKPFKTLSDSVKIEGQIRAAVVQWISESTGDVFQKLADDHVDSNKLKQAMNELSDSLESWGSK